MALAALFAVLSLVRAASAADLVKVPGRQVVSVLSVVVPLALFVAFVVWSNLAKGLVEAHGGTVALVRNWAVAVSSLVLFLSYLLPMKTPVAFHVVRATAAILLVIGALAMSVRLQRRLTGPAAPNTAAHPGAAATPAGSRAIAGSVGPRSVSVTGLMPPAEPQPEDWNAALWDPEVQVDIERRRRHRQPRT
ncbi:hypothetical protein JNW91_02320 [Micromonospora sp. STR1_7]|uniref:EamA domain-containing protein n=1 Tax=Micromonospora parastrephiae TaxID=2806101 RepID=A0ABS1XNK3_9ACTN|nr:hypothetical protein [Micromonospora parastrephiae]MBM0230812.1 hypothetical protein [Micromonospora parastrephiae]